MRATMVASVDGSDLEELERLTGALRCEFLAADFDAQLAREGQAPAGAKGEPRLSEASSFRWPVQLFSALR
ncbi:hypothetical protein GCM10022222_38500 [Amycolatopsis ultiminotia]|uniref:Uncharacterized protein n=1 Tax=Amycolatopsis ultiminotia TaxID=543629 RepID=A0ABP6WIR5_9PSEU